MTAFDLISYDIPPLKLSDSGIKAMDWMEEFKVSVLPVTDEGKYVGIIEESEILDKNNPEDPIKEYNINFHRPFIHQNQHFFEVVTTMTENEIDVLPVINDNNEYLGLISLNAIVTSFAKMSSINNPGSILTLEIKPNDYSLSEIAKLVESDDAKIISSFITSTNDVDKLEVTIKINKTDISRILQTFYRFNYKVTASYNESEYMEDLKNRFDEFMRFLNP